MSGLITTLGNALRDLRHGEGLKARPPNTPYEPWPRDGHVRHVNGKDQVRWRGYYRDAEGGLPESPRERQQLERAKRTAAARAGRTRT